MLTGALVVVLVALGLFGLYLVFKFVYWLGHKIGDLLGM